MNFQIIRMSLWVVIQFKSIYFNQFFVFQIKPFLQIFLIILKICPDQIWIKNIVIKTIFIKIWIDTKRKSLNHKKNPIIRHFVFEALPFEPNHNHHQGILAVWISLTLSYHLSLLIIAHGKSSGWDPVSTQWSLIFPYMALYKMTNHLKYSKIILNWKYWANGFKELKDTFRNDMVKTCKNVYWTQ